MKLGTVVGLGPGHIVLDGDPAPPPQRGTAPNFRPMSVVAKRLDGSRCLFWYTEVGLGSGDIVLDGDPARSPLKRGRAPTFRPMFIVAKRSPISATAEHLLTYANGQTDQNEDRLKGRSN